MKQKILQEIAFVSSIHAFFIFLGLTVTSLKSSLRRPNLFEEGAQEAQDWKIEGEF